ncbi:MAG: DNA polymerase III subunit delta [Ruminococcaceae bacterium]|nr:DNA polymerase III subunit delta [Oscillospiraceae bacterium]
MLKMEELKQILKGEKPSPRVFLLWGEEDFLRAYYRKELMKRFMPENMAELNVFMFEGKQYRLGEVDEAIEGLPVFAEQKLLVFTDSQIFKPDGRTGAKAEYRDYWAKRLADIPDYVTIIFDESGVDKRSALLKQVDKMGGCVEFAYLGEDEMVRWTGQLFAKLGKKITAADARYLNEVTASGMMAIKREAEKLVAYVGDRPQVMRADIDLLVMPETENRVFDMVAAILKRDANGALRLLEDLFILKTEPLQILGAILYNAERLLYTRVLTEAGADKSQIMTKLKMSPFATSKFMKDSQQYSMEQLRYFVQRASETDEQMKSNSIENEVLLSLLVSELSTSI